MHLSQLFSSIRRIVIATFLVVCLPIPATVAQESSKAFADRMNSFANELMELEMIPGAAVVVVQGDEILFHSGFGLADRESDRKVTPDTVFYIASSTKSFTGLASAICENRGELDLDESLASLLPDASFHEDLDPSTIRYRDLLTHTHGIDNNGPVSFRSAYSGQHTDESLKELLKHHGAAAYGKTFRYSNIGYNVTGLAIRNKLDIHWKDLLKREIFDPLGMTTTTGYVSQVDPERLAIPYSLEPTGFKRLHYAKADSNMHAAGGLVTSTSDLAQWLKANINHGKIDGKQVIPEAVFQTAHRPYAEQDSQYMSFHRSGYGLGWNTGRYDEDEFIHHFGGFTGFHCHISFMPRQKIGVAILVNTSAGGVFADTLARYAYDTLLEKPGVEDRFAKETGDLAKRLDEIRKRIKADRDRRAARPQTLPRSLDAYAGTFNNQQYGEVTFKVVGGILQAEMGPLWSAVEVFDGSKDALRVELTGSGQVAQFVFEGDEPARQIRLSNGMVFDRVEK